MFLEVGLQQHWSDGLLTGTDFSELAAAVHGAGCVVHWPMVSLGVALSNLYPVKDVFEILLMLGGDARDDSPVEPREVHRELTCVDDYSDRAARQDYCTRRSIEGHLIAGVELSVVVRGDCPSGGFPIQNIDLVAEFDKSI